MDDPKTWLTETLRLCPDGAIHNDSNAERAAKVLLAVYPAYDNETARSGMCDMLCDIRHLFDLMGWDFAADDRRAYQGYLEELHECGIAKDEDLKAAVERDLS